jgi:hypothetical protein
MQDGFVPVWAGTDSGSLIGHVIRFNRRTGKLTIQITDPEVVQELDEGVRIGLGLSMHEVREPRRRLRDGDD